MKRCVTFDEARLKIVKDIDEYDEAIYLVYHLDEYGDETNDEPDTLSESEFEAMIKDMSALYNGYL